MSYRRLLRPLALDAGLLGLLTVGGASALTRSGALVLALAGAGVLCIALGGGTAGQVSASGSAFAENAGLGAMVDDMGIWPGSGSGVSGRVRLLFYGVGLVTWSVVVLVAFSSHLR
ncbi:hypothetical protein M0R89_18410 (plasmid) [Halorussus limi]|uniref:DUF8070 domain-containing protein n=1 Tax=Halorussus limi TaxID=2938695 RepID=A0A8U0HZZ8_9EURY|nr:hypothetical protein [Halorussus limi]UPV76508.1 hypothetical protein M0R89_18410 [Halorussus limi]